MILRQRLITTNSLTNEPAKMSMHAYFSGTFGQFSAALVSDEVFGPTRDILRVFDAATYRGVILKAMAYLESVLHSRVDVCLQVETRDSVRLFREFGKVGIVFPAHIRAIEFCASEIEPEALLNEEEERCEMLLRQMLAGDHQVLHLMDTSHWDYSMLAYDARMLTRLPRQANYDPIPREYVRSTGRLAQIEAQIF